MNIHIWECKYYFFHLVPKFGDVRNPPNWRLHPTGEVRKESSEYDITRKLLSLSLDLFIEIWLFPVTFLLVFFIAIFYRHFFLIGLLLQYVALFQSTVKSQSSGKSSLFYSYASIDIKASTQMTFYCFSFKCVTWVGIDFKFEGYCIKTECMASIYVVEIGADFTLCWCSA